MPDWEFLITRQIIQRSSPSRWPIAIEMLSKKSWNNLMAVEWLRPSAIAEPNTDDIYSESITLLELMFMLLFALLIVLPNRRVLSCDIICIIWFRSPCNLYLCKTTSSQYYEMPCKISQHRNCLFCSRIYRSSISLERVVALLQSDLVLVHRNCH